MSEVIRVLQVFGVLNRGGAESRTMDLYRNIDKSKIQFDFVKHTTSSCAFDQEIESLGGHVYSMPAFKVYNIISYKKAWKKLMQEHPEIRIVHGHMTSTAGIYLPIAKKYGAFTIAHVRNAGVDKGMKGWITNILRINLKNKCDQCFTCSRLAGEAVYGKKAMQSGEIIIRPNAIDIEKFQFDVEKRNQMRTNLGYSENDFVIGHVGRFDPMKNQSFLVEIFQECIKQNSNCRLLLLGDGSLRDTVKEKAKTLGVEAFVTFTGVVSNPQDYYQAFDCFILPSLYEGLPGVAIEAQASGLPGIISDQVTDETIVTPAFKQMKLKDSPKQWAEVILSFVGGKRQSGSELVRDAGFDVTRQAKWLQNFYMEAIK